MLSNALFRTSMTQLLNAHHSELVYRRAERPTRSRMIMRSYDLSNVIHAAYWRVRRCEKGLHFSIYFVGVYCDI
jgi:hypothetical protein